MVLEYLGKVLGNVLLYVWKCGIVISELEIILGSDFF